MDIMEVHCRAEDVDWYSYQGFSEDYIKGDVGGSTGTCAHENETEDVTTSAGCTTPGSKVITCEDCGAELRTVTIPALGHLEKDEIITAATCETAGSKNVVCTRCSNTINNVEIKALGHNIVAGKCTREGCDYTEPAQEDLFQKFFESRTADMTAVNSADKAWTALPSGLKYKLKASGSEEKVFTLTMKKGGYLTVKGTVSQPMAKVTATDANKKMVGTLSSTSYMPTTTAFEATVEHGDVITFTVSSYTYATDSYYVEITDITLDETCLHSLSQEVAAEAATCTKDGNNLYYECLVCKGKFKDKACTTPMSDAEAIIPASHTYDESKNVAVDGGKATVKSCSVCKLTTVVAGSGEGTPAYTVTLGGEHLTFTAEGKTGTSYTVGSGKNLYFLAKVESGYMIKSSGTAVKVDGYDGPYKVENVTANKTVTLTTAAAPKAEYSFDLRTENGTQVAYITGYKGNGGDITIQKPGGSVYFAQFETDDIAYNVISMSGSEYTAEVRKVKKTSGSKLNGASGTLTIPETVTITKADTDFTFTIIGIGEKALYEYENGYSSSDYWFAEVKFPSTLQYIGKWGCSGLAGVTEIDLSNTKVASIGSFAFNNCESLETIKLPATLATFGGETKTETKENAGQSTDKDTSTGGYDGGSESNKKFDGKQEESVCYTENVFMGCQSLQNILVAAGNPGFKDVDGVLFTKDGKTLVRYPVGKSATSYTIPDGTEIIEECAFMQTATGMQQKPGKLQTVTFPRSLKQIKSGAFRQTSLTSVQLPANVTFGSYIFDCSKTLATVTTEPGVTKIPDKAFWGCEKLTSVTLGDSVTAIGVSAFERTGLTGIDLNKVTDIGNYAFYGSKLTTVTVPAAEKTGTARS